MKSFFFYNLLLIILFCIRPLEALKNILIYDGPGASEECIFYTEVTLKSKVKGRYEVKRIHPQEVLNGGWEKDTALFVIPGGADIPYTQVLNGVGNKRIKEYVTRGGNYLGFCAGAYYGTSAIEFSKGDPEMEVIGSRELAFYPGKAVGPSISKYSYKDNSGARVVKLISPGGQTYYAYYNGGPHFEDPLPSSNVEVLAYYAANKKPAIVKCKVGKGLVILTGAHFEYREELFNERDPYHAKLRPILETHSIKIEALRDLVLEQLLP